jgi:integrase
MEELHTKDLKEARRLLSQAPKNKQDRQIEDLTAQVALLTQTIQAMAAMQATGQAEKHRQTQDTLETILTKYLSSRKWKSDATLKMYQSRGRKITKLCKDSFQNFLDLGPYEVWRQVDGKPAMQNHIASLLRGFSRYLSKEKLIPNHDQWMASLKEIPKEKTKSRKLLHVPSPKQLEELCNQLELENKTTAELCRLLAYTGIRIGGAASLEWHRVAPDRSWIEVNEKGDKTRQIQIPHAAKATLERLWLAQGKPVKGPVFRFSEKQHRPERNALRKAAQIVGSPLETFHLLRHWFTSQAIGTYDVRSLSRHLGHEDGGALLLKTYTHADDQRMKELAETLPF